MRLRLNAVRFTELKAKIRRGTAVDLRTVFGETRLSLLWLQRVPVERKRRDIKGLRIKLFIFTVLLCIGKLIEHEKICAVFEIMALLRDFHLNITDRLSCLAHKLQERKSFLICLHACGNTIFHVVLFLFEQLQDFFP